MYTEIFQLTYYDIMIKKIEPLFKAWKNNLAEQESFSRADKMVCRRYVRACMGSRFPW
jgi:hypothetical protein